MSCVVGLARTIYTVYVRYILLVFHCLRSFSYSVLQGINQAFGHIQRKYTVLANAFNKCSYQAAHLS